MVVMASNGPSPHPSSLRLGLPAPQPSRRHRAQSLLGPSFHDPRTHHVLESHPERAAPLSRRNDERCHAIGSHSVLALRLYLAAYNHRDATTLSPCWAPHFMTQERFMFSNPTPSKPRLSPAATIDATTSFLTPPLHCASILQPAAPPQVVAVES